MEDSSVIQQETLVDDTEEESNEMTGVYGDIQELSEPVGENENNPVDDAHNERLVSLQMEFIEIMVVDEAPHVDAEQPIPQSSSPSKQEEKSSISEGEQHKQEEEENSLMQSSFPPPEAAAVEEEENSQMRPTFSLLGEDDSSKESSFPTEEEEDSTLQSSFSTEAEEDGNGENAAELDEESSEGTRSSSQEPNMEVIWPAEIMTFISSAPKEIDLSHLESEMKAIEDGKPNKGEPYYDSARDNNKETGEPAVMDVRKQHTENRQTWFWLGLVVLVLALLANCLLQPNYLSNTVSFVFLMK
ncbi:nucleolar protein 12-like [Hibiscus syriacus]|uniref:nucleolar protein 12-like n=1 Tax=Hibiscus syriacus TaxID=106335 RepID=UPI0019208F99|nr:nucleolar protein 12-like [Hibiscus syriacus]